MLTNILIFHITKSSSCSHWLAWFSKKKANCVICAFLFLEEERRESLTQSRETAEGHGINCFVTNTNFTWTFPFGVGGQIKIRKAYSMRAQHSPLMVLEWGDLGPPEPRCHPTSVPRCHPWHPQTRWQDKGLLLPPSSASLINFYLTHTHIWDMQDALVFRAVTGREPAASAFVRSR